jgi:ketol-acid reductoisomerase
MPLYYDADASAERLHGRPIAVIGFGSQGHAHALNLHESGLDVRVGLPAESASRRKAAEAGLRVTTVAEAADEAQLVMLLVPDHVQHRTYARDIAPQLTSGTSASSTRLDRRERDRPGDVQ